jgi:PAS domain-containing protein
MAWELLATIGGVITAGVGAYTKVVKPILEEEKKRKAELLQKIDDIKGELSFNGGGSLKDVVYRIEGKIIRLDSRIGSLEENQRAILNLNNVAYWVSNELGECVEASPSLCKMLGRSESEIKGNNWASWLVQNDKKRIFDAWEYAIKNKMTFDEIYSFIKPDDSIVKVWGLAFHKEDGGVFGKLEIYNEN